MFEFTKAKMKNHQHNERLSMSAKYSAGGGKSVGVSNLLKISL